jgi:hypothetical protein
VAKRRKTTDIAAELEIQRGIVTEVDGLDEPSEDDIARSEAALELFEALQLEFAEAQEYEDRVEAVRSAAAYSTAVEPVSGPTPIQRSRGPEVKTSVDPFEILRGSTGHMDEPEIIRALADSNLKALDEFEMPDGYNGSFETYIKRHRKDISWSRNLLSRMTPDYIGAFEKLMVGRDVFLSDVERAAIAVGTNTAGGYLVPTHLDPTLILTNAGAKDVVRTLSRVVSLTGGANRWNGVSTAGSTASWDAELTEVSDDTPPIAPIQIPVFSALV